MNYQLLSSPWHSDDEDECEQIVASSTSYDLTSSTSDFSLYRQLSLKIKRSLKSSRKSNPEVRIDMDFDKYVYDEHMRRLGTHKKKYRGNDAYHINHYSDLDKLLESKWFIRGINSHGDFCYAILDTVEFYLRKKQVLIEYKPVQDGLFERVTHDQGFSLVFTFVRGDGVSSDFQNVYSMQ